MNLPAFDGQLRLRVGLGAGALLLGVLAFAACGGCRSAKPASITSTSGAPSASADEAASAGADGGVTTPRGTSLMWTSAKDGDVEDLSNLANHEGAIGLVEAAADPGLRPTAIRAMGYAAGWAQLPFLANAAASGPDADAKLALEATVELAARPRRSEDPEDADELREGCDGLDKLARDTAKPRPRRLLAIRALRMMPCPEAKTAIPTELDAK